MYTKWVVALLLCWCGAGVVESTLTACPQVTPPSEFNVTGILGTWYEIYHFKTDFEDANETCSTDTLSLTPEGFIRADEYDFNVTTGVYEHDVHVSSLSDTSKLTMNITLEGYLYGVNLWILASDYNRYMVRWACFEITDNTIIDEEYNACSSALCNFLHSPVTSSCLAPNIFLSTLFSNTLNLCSSLRVRVQVSQPYRTTGNITVLYILTFRFFDSRLDDKSFSTE
ncbi:hypothetical protein ANN_00189 [Periplaneta americana]|uniref:Lipocalin/cytosolic fatty-acid binding domain-containing protein n=1 Tax=Periplaneta americana TaxID=6978 RepID=A0ABQ8TQ27_PERAM|nr:hypothetical protein ANN_00189 [Periplaneta americana]